MFAVVEAALLQPLPFRDADRLVVVWGVAGPEQDIRGASPIEIRDWDDGTDALGPLAKYVETTVNLSGGVEAEQLDAEMVGPDYLAVLGVRPVLGRDFVAEDDDAGAAGSAIISHDLWQRRFGGAEDVLGRSLRLDDVPFTVVGVAPAGFRGLSFDTEVWVPQGPFASPEALADRGGRYLAALGRLVPGATAERAQEQLEATAARLAERFPAENRDRSALVFSLRDYYVGQSRALLLMVFAGVGLLLLVASANVANLQLVRALERRRDVALRYAVGAGRARVGRELVLESVVLAAFGAAAGLALAWAGLQLLLPLIPVGVLPPYAGPSIDGPVIGFTVATALTAGILFAMVPAVRAGRERAITALRSGGRTAPDGRRGRWFGAQQAVVVAEVALALVLLVTAGLAVRSLRAQLELDPGFHPSGALAARVSMAPERYDRMRRVAFARELTEQVAAIPGVRAAALVSAAPLRGYSAASYIFRAEDEIAPEHRIRFYRHSLTPGGFRALGIPLVDGRAFTAADRADAPGVVVVSEAFAAKVWPGEEPVGRRLTFGGDTATVIGIAGDVRYRTLTTDLMDPGEDPDVYFAYAQVPTGSVDIVVRTAGPAGALAGPLRRAVGELDAALPLYDIATLEAAVAQQTALARLVSFLLTTFGVLALVIAGVGIYGVLASVVRGRHREIAIRAAVGARPATILRLIVGQGMALVIVGLLAGLLASLLVGRLAASLLFGVQPADPLVLAGTTAALLAVAGAASYLPARRATAVDPRAIMDDG